MAVALSGGSREMLPPYIGQLTESREFTARRLRHALEIFNTENFLKPAISPAICALSRPRIRPIKNLKG